MAYEFYPPSSPGAPHPYGIGIAIATVGDYETRKADAVAAFRSALEADMHVPSLTSLSDRLVQTNPESGSPEAAIQYYVSEHDYSVGVIDVWVAIPTDGRGVLWPSVAADKATLDSIIASLA